MAGVPSLQKWRTFQWEPLVICNFERGSPVTLHGYQVLHHLALPRVQTAERKQWTALWVPRPETNPNGRRIFVRGPLSHHWTSLRGVRTLKSTCLEGRAKRSRHICVSLWFLTKKQLGTRANPTKLGAQPWGKMLSHTQSRHQVDISLNKLEHTRKKKTQQKKNKVATQDQKLASKQTQEINK